VGQKGRITVAHLSDEHWSSEKLDKCRKSARFIESALVTRRPDLIVIAGDLQDRRQYATGSSAFNPMREHIYELATIAPVAIVSGNENHDPSGSLDFLARLDAPNPIHVAARPSSVLLQEVRSTNPSLTRLQFTESGSFQDAYNKVALHFLPYPSKEWLQQGVLAASVETTNQAAEDHIRAILAGFGVFKEFGLPTVLVAHCNVKQAVWGDAQPVLGQDILVDERDLELSRADLICLGHIHRAQQVGERAFYAGSTYHCDWGETEDKGFRVHELTAPDHPGPSLWHLESEWIKIPSTPMVLAELVWDSDSGNFASLDSGEIQLIASKAVGAEVRVRIRAPKERLSRMTDDLVNRIFTGAASVTIERLPTPEVRVRSDIITSTKRLRDKVAEWAKVTDRKDVTESVLDLADEVERSVQPE
jgi:exonuclease SbcD